MTYEMRRRPAGNEAPSGITTDIAYPTSSRYYDDPEEDAAAIERARWWEVMSFRWARSGVDLPRAFSGDWFALDPEDPRREDALYDTAWCQYMVDSGLAANDDDKRYESPVRPLEVAQRNADAADGQAVSRRMSVEAAARRGRQTVTGDSILDRPAR